MNLKAFRGKIDKADKEIIRLIARRQSYAPAIAKIKKKIGASVLQPRREAEVLASRQMFAKKHGLNTKLIRNIFILILKDSRRIQGRS